MDDGLLAIIANSINPKLYYWKPKPDITSYELALAIPILTFRRFDIEKVINELPEEVQRHFESIELDRL